MGRAAESARAADVTEEVWEGVCRVWQAFALMLPEGGAAIGWIREWVRQHAV